MLLSLLFICHLAFAVFVASFVSCTLCSCNHSSEFCEQHLQLLFTILEKSNNAVVRANAVIALGDLTFRFPNLIEPWTSHIYARCVFVYDCDKKMNLSMIEWYSQQ